MVFKLQKIWAFLILDLFLNSVFDLLNLLMKFLSPYFYSLINRRQIIGIFFKRLIIHLLVDLHLIE